jgi:type VI protein secretion system component Hcp
MATIFMLAAPFKGESKAKGYEGNVDLDSCSFSVSQAYRVEQQGGGAQAMAGDIVCSKGQDASSPIIQQFCMNGETIPTVEIHVTKQIKDTPILVYKIILGNVVVGSYSCSTGGDSVMESFSLNYGNQKVEYTPVDEKGKKGGAVTAGYDFVAQTPV